MVDFRPLHMLKAILDRKRMKVKIIPQQLGFMHLGAEKSIQYHAMSGCSVRDRGYYLISHYVL